MEILREPIGNCDSTTLICRHILAPLQNSLSISGRSLYYKGAVVPLHVGSRTTS